MTWSCHYDRNDLYCEGVSLADVAARAGTPCYVYSSRTIVEN
jgi:diaminopimelate decarboxylase